jgi:pimeloyl-ACP methyl ester carboxylesterase
VVVCVHGLTRQGRDFDTLAQALVGAGGPQLRVICPDVAGRGRSDWLPEAVLYQVPQYASDMLSLLAQVRPRTLDWLGTSMGGIIGMALAGAVQLPPGVSVRRLLLNDIGPAMAWPAIERIGQYLGQTGAFDSEEQAARALWTVAASFGPHTPAQWLALTRPQLKPLADGSGRLTLHYDPKLAEPFLALTPALAAQGEAAGWQAYDRISAQTLVVRGRESDLLLADTAQAMTQRGPRAALVELAGVGHAPTWVADDQVQLALAFLLHGEVPPDG